MSEKINISIGDDGEKSPGFFSRIWTAVQFVLLVAMLLFAFIAYDVNYREPGAPGRDLVDRR